MLIPISNENFITNEFCGLKFGDHRLNERAMKVAKIINESPNLSFPNAAKGKRGELKALYRFFQNDKVTLDKIMETHYHNTIQRCLQSFGPILLVTDSVFMMPVKWKMMEGLKVKGTKNNDTLRIHYMIAIDGKTHEILGITDFRIIGDNIHKTNIKLNEECEIWELVTQSTLKRIKDIAPNEFMRLRDNLVFIADREADGYHIYDSLRNLNVNFIIRNTYKRRLIDKSTNELKLFPELKEQEMLHGRPYDLTIHEQGKSKTIKVQRSVLKNYTVYPPERNSSKYSENYELYDPMELSMVFVRELENSENDKKMEWRIFTSLNVSNPSESEKMVEYYRCRWKCEELNKGAKTGVNLERRQFTNLEHLKPAIGMMFIVAWRILTLRDLNNYNSEALASEVMNDDEIDYLEERLKIPRSKLKIKQALDYIAKQGGFLGSYKNPGWIVLWKGWFQFNLQVDGFSFAKKIYKIKK